MPNTRSRSNLLRNQYLTNGLYDDLADLGWDYTAGRMSRSGMEIYDKIMTALGVLDDGEHWNEDCYQDHNCCLLYTSPSPRDYAASRMPSSA